MPKDVITYTITGTVPDGDYLKQYEALARLHRVMEAAVLEMASVGFLDVAMTHDLHRQPVPRARKASGAAEAVAPPDPGSGSASEPGSPASEQRSEPCESPGTMTLGDVEAPPAADAGMTSKELGAPGTADFVMIHFGEAVDVGPEHVVLLPEGRTEVPHGRGKRTA